MTDSLFSPFALRDLQLENRLVVSPMCQYSATDGLAGDWHLAHLGQFAISAWGLVITEAIGVEPRGRITPACLGLWNDDQADALERVVGFFRAHGRAKLGVQLGHSGRKGSTAPPFVPPTRPGIAPPWLSGQTLLPDDPGGWLPVAPSPLPAKADNPVPETLDAAGLASIRQAFVDATRRADRIGIDLIELHAAHGYLLHQFLSPLSNQRDDEYGGSLENRLRYPLEVFDAMRAVWPEGKPLGVRISATDWVDGGWDISGSIAFAKALETRGCDFITVSSGGLSVDQKITLGPAYHMPFTDQLRPETTIPLMAVGLIDEPQTAAGIVKDGRADLIALARGALNDPRWPWHAAQALGESVEYAPQYQRAGPPYWHGEPQAS